MHSTFICSSRLTILTTSVATGLIEMTGDKAAPGLWMNLAAVFGLIATLTLYRRQRQAATPEPMRVPAA